MNGKLLFTVTVLIGWAVCCNAEPEPSSDGKYNPNEYGSGKYIPSSEGRYVHDVVPYVHVHDNRELGIYHHIHNPYNGGYGPYSGDIDKYRYKGDPSGEYSQYTVSNAEFEVPAVPLEYGFPEYTPIAKEIENASIEKRSIAKRSIATNANKQSVLAILPIQYISYDGGLQSSKILVDSQTTSTTTSRPRIRYNDEGKWRIIRQEELKRNHKYDYLYLTENGIYAEEQGKLVNEHNQATGTSGKGYYKYTGDDGKLYKVEYTVGEQGFVPSAEHIPTPPPVPAAIQKALEFVAAQERLQTTRY